MGGVGWEDGMACRGMGWGEWDGWEGVEMGMGMEWNAMGWDGTGRGWDGDEMGWDGDGVGRGVLGKSENEGECECHRV